MSVLAVCEYKLRAWCYWWRCTLTPHFCNHRSYHAPWTVYQGALFFFCLRFTWLRLRLLDVTWIRDKTFEPPLVIFTFLHVELIRNRPETWLWAHESAMTDEIGKIRP